MTPERVGQLTLDPAMQELIASFRDHEHVRAMTGMNEIELLRNISIQNALRSAMAMSDSLNYYEDADEKMPVRESAKIFELASDRVGFGKHVTNTNVNIDFAAQLDLAIDRSRNMRTISAFEAKPQVLPTLEGASPGPNRPSRAGTGEQGLDHPPAPPISVRRF